MQYGFINKTINSFVENGIIEDDDKEIYAFGMKQGLVMVLNVATTVVIGALLGMVWQSLIYMISFIPLRRFAGGYHARTELQCYLSSVILISTSLLAIKLMQSMSFIFFGLSALGSIIVYFYAPVEDANKPLDDLERSVYKKRTRTILVLEICVLLFFLCVGQVMASICVAVSLGVIGFLVIMGKLSQRG